MRLANLFVTVRLCYVRLVALAAATDADFERRVLQSERPVLVKYWAEWCMPCFQMKPVVFELSVHFAEQVDFVSVDIDENPVSVEASGVSGVPMLVLFRGGKPAASRFGSAPYTALARWLEKALAQSSAAAPG